MKYETSSLRQTFAYLALSLLAGITELGVALYALQRPNALSWLICSVGAYQIGSLFCNPVRLRREWYAVALFLSALLSTLSASYCGFVATVFLTSVGLHGCRELSKHAIEVATSTKRVLRVTGFLVAACYSNVMLMAIPVAALVLFLTLVPLRATLPSRAGRREMGLLGLTMVVHQSHYFSYAYLMLPLFIVFQGYRGASTPVLQLLAVSGAFCIGWVSYTAAEWLSKRVLHLEDRLACVLGHILVSVCLVCILAWSRSPLVVCAAWFVSGFGGGTVYCLRNINRGLERPVDMDFWENVGHITGLLLCAATLAISGGNVLAPFATAAAMAMITAAMVLYGGRTATGTGGEAIDPRVIGHPEAGKIRS